MNVSQVITSYSLCLAQYTLNIEYSDLKSTVKNSQKLHLFNYDTSKKPEYLSGLVTTMQVYPRAECNPN